MSRQLSNNLISELMSDVSSDPFLTLVTLSHDSFDSDVRFVNNITDIVSRGNTFYAFAMNIGLPTDDGETQRELQIDFDNVSLEIMRQIRSVTTPIKCKIEMILASRPDIVEIEYSELKIKNVNCSKSSVRARLFLDDFLNTEMTSEKYTPTNFRGIF